jgi:uncharacterized tellurite resistance protein B-like protein
MAALAVSPKKSVVGIVSGIGVTAVRVRAAGFRRALRAMGLHSRIVKAIRDRHFRRVIARRLDRDPVTVAQILLLFRMMLLDGVVRQREIETFEQICASHFGIAMEEMQALHAYLEKRQTRADGEAREKLLRSISMGDRLRLIRLMGQIAQAGAQPNPATLVAPPDAGSSEQRLIRETALSLGIDARGESNDVAAKG